MEKRKVDVAIVGAGPAGSTLALFLAKSGLQVAIFDKAHYPREVICGDALSGQVLNVLRRMPDTIYADFLAFEPKTPSRGIRFYAPGNEPLELSFLTGNHEEEVPPGYICPRILFDNFLVDHVRNYPSITFHESVGVQALKRNGKSLFLTTDAGEVEAKMVVGADGLNSIVRRHFSARRLDKQYYCMAARSYYTGVTGFPPGNFLELIFLNELLPAYFWIFPEVGGKANVGLGLPYPEVIKRRLSLKHVMEELVRTHPLIAPRFTHAQRVDPVKARGLALHRDLENLSGDRFLLVGDAALLVDPFTKEGIGFAMASAESAAAVIRKAFEKEDFSANFLADYDHRINRRMGMEHRTSAFLQRHARYPRLFDVVVRKANRNEAFHALLSSALTNDDVRKKLSNPLFYLRLLANR